MKLIIASLLFIFSSPSYSAASDISAFATSLEKLLGIDRKQLEDIGSKISIKYSARMKPNAAATYTPLFNRITFSPEIAIEDMGVKRVRTIEELEQSTSYSSTVHATTIFHELAHAELDTIVSKSSLPIERELNALMTQSIKPWFKKYFPKFNAQASMHEFYAYYRTDFLETMFNDLSDLYLYNGWNQFQKRCFAGIKVKELRKVLTKEEFLEFFIPDDEVSLRPYEERIRVQYVYVNGKEFDLTTVKTEPFRNEWFSKLYDYLRHEYKAPFNKVELANHVKLNFKDKLLFRKCREALWETLPAQ
ncbi:MAG: hypothetical protein Fur0010_09510 [Bdellovibrio sp.]